MLRCEQHKQKLPRQSTYSPTCGQPRKKPRFNTLPGKTLCKEVEEAMAAEEAEVVEAVEVVEAEEAAEETP